MMDVDYARGDPGTPTECEARSDTKSDDSSDEESSDADLLEEEQNTEEVTAAEVLRGRDIQGIPWQLLQTTRERYRQTRLRQYQNYENLGNSHDRIDQEITQVWTNGEFYKFRVNTRTVRSSILHFQLRNLVWASSAHDVYLMYQSGSHRAYGGALVQHWSSITKRCTEAINLSGGPDAHEAVQISTMAVKDGLILVGGFRGELVAGRCNSAAPCEVVHSARVTQDENGITNAIELFDSVSGELQAMVCNNDKIVRVFNVPTFETLSRFYFDWAVNHAAMSPDRKLLCVVGDDTTGLLADASSGKVIATLSGHVDYSFASAWHPNGRIVATGNQDKTCRLWDIRHLGSSLVTLGGRLGAIRSIRFTSDGKYMAMSEPADFVHIFDANANYQRSQEIDVFGEIAGISFAPEGSQLFVGISDRIYGSLLEYERVRHGLLDHTWI